MKKTAKTVIQLLDSVAGALDLAPVPCLGVAWKGFKALWDAVQKVQLLSTYMRPYFTNSGS
jgi:hypothetical protein